MSRVFEVDAHDIEQLDDRQLNRLLLTLLRLEARAADISRSCIHGTLSINAPDDGEDASIEWKEGPEATEWIPARFTLFQSKATDVSPADWTSEVLLAGQNKLKPRISDVLLAKGVYVVFTGTSLNEKMIKRRTNVIRSAIKTVDKLLAESAKIEFYDSTKTASWTNNFVSAIAYVRNVNGRGNIDGLQTWAQVEGHLSLRTKFVTEEALQSKISDLRKLFSGPRAICRIIGLSGLGKTRLVIEAFRSPPQQTGDLDQHTLSDGFVYADGDVAGLSLVSSIIEWRSEGKTGTLVVDNCSDSLHNKLKAEVNHAENSIGLLTIDYASNSIGKDHAYIQITPHSDQLIKGIVEQAYPNLGRPDIERVVGFAGGFPKIAVMLADAHLQEVPDIARLKDDEFVNHILWGRDAHDHLRYRVISTCALFDTLGFEGDFASERKIVAENICGVTDDQFYAIAKEFIDKGVLDQRRRFVRVIPRPLAITLAADWWSHCPAEKSRLLFTDQLPSRIQEALCVQMSNLQFLPEAQKVVEALCGENGPFGEAKVLESELGSELFRSLVEVNPEATCESIWRAFNSYSLDDLKKIVKGRRNLVWSLEKLSFWEAIFPRAARMLMRFAAAENESWANNATGQFLQLFHLLLSGTQASPQPRLELVDEMLGSSEPAVITLAVKALGEGLQTVQFSRTVGVEQQGSRPASRDWQPRTFDDAYKYQSACLTRLTKIAQESGSYSSEAIAQIIPHIRGLVFQGFAKDVDENLRAIYGADGSTRAAFLEKIRETLRYDSGKLEPSVLQRLKDLEALLLPMTLRDRLTTVVSVPSWDHWKEEDGKHIDLAEQEAIEMAKEVASDLPFLFESLPTLVQGEQRKGFIFGYTLFTSISQHSEFLNAAINAIREIEPTDANPDIIGGFLAAARLTDRTLVAYALDAFAADPKLAELIVDVTRMVSPDAKDLDRLIQSVRSKRTTVRQLAKLSYGNCLGHLDPLSVNEFCEKISDLDPDATPIALSILYMYCFIDPQKKVSCSGTLKKLLLKPNLLKLFSSADTFGLHQWQDALKIVVGSDRKEVDTARQMAIMVTEFCLEKQSVLSMDYALADAAETLLREYSEDVWPIFGKALIADGQWAHHNMISLLKSRRVPGEDEESDLLIYVAVETLLKWGRENSPEGPLALLDVIVPFRKNDGGWAMKTQFLRVLEEFSSVKGLFEVASTAFELSGWMGSAVPYYERRIIVLRDLATCNLPPTIHKWSKDLINTLEARKAYELERDKERDLGFM